MVRLAISLFWMLLTGIRFEDRSDMLWDFNSSQPVKLTQGLVSDKPQPSAKRTGMGSLRDTNWLLMPFGRLPHYSPLSAEAIRSGKAQPAQSASALLQKSCTICSMPS